MRGEYVSHMGDIHVALELPPRARRIRVVSDVAGDVFGTTSACAENTTTNANPKTTPRNYLRVRGEYMKTDMERLNLEELPPRARRILPKRVP